MVRPEEHTTDSHFRKNIRLFVNLDTSVRFDDRISANARSMSIKQFYSFWNSLGIGLEQVFSFACLILVDGTPRASTAPKVVLEH